MTMFANIIDGEIVKVGFLPKWLSDDGLPLTEEQWEENGWFKIQTADQIPVGKMSISQEVQMVDGSPRYVHTGFVDIPDPSIDPADYPLLPWQFKAMIIYLDKDEDIQLAISQIENPMTRAASMSRYLNASYYDYSDPLMQSMRQAVGMSEQDLSDAWMLAKDLRSND